MIPLNIFLQNTVILKSFTVLRALNFVKIKKLQYHGDFSIITLLSIVKALLIMLKLNGGIREFFNGHYF